MKIIPKAIEEEKIILGTLINDCENAIERLNGVENYHFYNQHHRTIFSAISEIIISSGDINIHSVLQRLNDDGSLDKVGGSFYITGLFDYYSLLQFQSAQERIIEVYKRRECREMFLRLGKDIDKRDFSELEAYIFRTLERLESNSSDGYIGIDKSVEDVVTDLKEQRITGKKPGLQSSYMELDEMCCGFEPGDLIIIGATTSMGKTSLALNIGLNIAEQGHSVGFVSLEMPSSQLTQRLIAQCSKSDIQKLRNGYLSDSEMELYYEYAETVSSYPISIDASFDNTISKIITRAKLQCKRKNLDLLIIDYLQLVKIKDKAENRNLELGEITSSLKQFAVKENIPVLLLSQLNRKAAGKQPILSELRDSGSIEQDADKILLLWRPEKDGIREDRDGNSTENMCFIEVAKNRNGSTGLIEMYFHGESTSFGSIINETSND